MTNYPNTAGVPEWTVSDRLRKAREERGLSQQELADASEGELRLRTISNYERARYMGERKRSTLRIWATRTGVPLEWILTGRAPSGGDGGDAVTIWYPTLRIAERELLAA